MKKTVCVDLDGVLAKYEHWTGSEKFGEPLPGAATFTRQLAETAHVVIFTTRCNREMNREQSAEGLRRRVALWLDDHGFAYHEIYIGQGKPHAAAYVDDRAVSCRPQVFGATAFRRALGRVKVLLEGE